jgi:hypothetical protein
VVDPGTSSENGEYLSTPRSASKWMVVGLVAGTTFMESGVLWGAQLMWAPVDWAQIGLAYWGANASDDSGHGKNDINRTSVGVRLELHAAPGSVLDPWLGGSVGEGWESYQGDSQTDANGTPLTPRTQKHGWDARGCAGVDIRLAVGRVNVTLGPELAAGSFGPFQIGGRLGIGWY